MYAITRGLEQVLDPATAAELNLNDIARGDGTLFVRDGVGIAGRGTAARIPADEASAWLAGLEHDSTVESHGPIALGVVPFRPGSACELLVPEVVVARRRRARTRSRSSGPTARMPTGCWPARPPGSVRGSHRAAHPDRGELHDRTAGAIEHYLTAVAMARDAVRAGALVKAVIARPITVSSDQPIDVHAVLRRLRASVRVELPLLDRRTRRGIARTPHRGRRQHRPLPPARRHRAAHGRRRPTTRCSRPN